MMHGQKNIKKLLTTVWWRFNSYHFLCPINW